jgi:hypothetical protein
MTPPSVKHRAAFLEVDGRFEQCSIASTLLGHNSPYVALFATKDAYARERREVIMNVLALIAVAIGDSIGKVTPPAPLALPGFVRLAMVNRATGEYWEDVGVSTPRSCALGDLLLRQVVARALDAVAAGATLLMWNDGLFRFAHQIVFVDDAGAVLPPQDPRTRPRAADQFAPQLWPRRQGVVVFQLLSVYMANVEPGTIEQENAERLRLRLRPALVGSATLPDLADTGIRKVITRASSHALDVAPH